MALQRQGSSVEEMIMKATGSKSLVLKINIAFLAFFFLVYVLVLIPSSSFYDADAATLVRCSFRDCHLQKVAGGEKRIITTASMETIPSSFLDGLGRHARVGLVNVEAEEAKAWQDAAYTLVDIKFEHVSELFEWKDIFPEWIDEEEESEGPTCPEIPLPELDGHDKMDVVVVTIPCRFPENGWARDVFRLQVHLAAAEVAVKKGRRDWDGKVRVVARSECRPMMEIFRCDDLVKREGDWWMFAVEARRLEDKLRLPVGSCKLALPLWKEGAINEKSDHSELKHLANPAKREAYATVIHSSDRYVCGAITLAQSIIKSGSDRDMVLLHDDAIPLPKLEALAAAGWKLHKIKRIRNPHAQKGTYNEYNYSKLRLWQLTNYSKIIFVDSDILVLRNLDLLFHFPQLSATGNDGVIFNSGIMVIEPSRCTFSALVERRHEIFSYNGGDQGFLNEAFVWWHRLPRRVNYLKNFWANTSTEAAVKNYLFGSDPPELYTIHYLGLKPWLCYRDYDCNWDLENQRIYASDVAHRRWWILYDDMDDGLKPFCGLSERRKIELEWDRMKAGMVGFPDEHWKINVTDRRRFE